MAHSATGGGHLKGPQHAQQRRVLSDAGLDLAGPDGVRQDPQGVRSGPDVSHLGHTAPAIRATLPRSTRETDAARPSPRFRLPDVRRPWRAETCMTSSPTTGPGRVSSQQCRSFPHTMTGFCTPSDEDTHPPARSTRAADRTAYCRVPHAPNKFSSANSAARNAATTSDNGVSSVRILSASTRAASFRS